MQSSQLKQFLGMATLLSALAVSPAFAATLTAVPSAPLTSGSTVEIDVRIDAVADLYAYQYSFVFDPTVLQFSSYADGGFLARGGSVIVDGGTPDNATGTLWFAFGALEGPVPGVTGNGNLARYTFNVIGGGGSTVSFTDVLLLDSKLNDVAVQFAPQVLAAVPEPSAYLTFGAGLAMLAALRRRQHRSRAVG